MTKVVKCKHCSKIVYDNSNSICCNKCENWFHVPKCAKIKIKDFDKFVKDKSLNWICTYCVLFPCLKCDKPVFNFQNKIKCICCSKLIHLKCSGLNRLNKQDDAFICNLCYAPPFSSLSNVLFLEELNVDSVFEDLSATNYTFDPQFDNFRKCCSVCNKKHSPKTLNKFKSARKLIPCNSCKSLIHRKCSNIPLSELLLNDKLRMSTWECMHCISSKFPFSNTSDLELDKLAFNSLFSCSCLKTTNFDSIRFKRFDFNSISSGKNGPDPFNFSDTYFNLEPKFNYADIHDFHKIKQKLPKKACFSLLHTNIQSLNHNFEQLEILINSLEFNFDIIALSEVWCPDEKLTFNPGILKGYHSYIGTKGSSLKSGCGMYIKDSLKTVERKDLSVKFCDNDNEFQSFWIEIYNKKSANILVGSFYRHPKMDSDDTFNNSLSETLKKITDENKVIVIAGDFNYDLLKIDSDLHAKSFIEQMYSSTLQPCILEPTRIVNGNRPSLIDNIFINTIDKNTISGNLTSRISDHMPNFLFLHDLIDKPSCLHKKVRDFSKFDETAFKNEVNNLSPDENLDIDIAFQKFQDDYVKIINKHAPFKTLSKQELKWKQKPWISSNIKSMIKTKDFLYSKFLRTKKTFWHDRFKLLRNNVKKSIFEAKKEFYKNYFENHKDNSRKIWQGISQIINKKAKNSSSEIYLITNGKTITDQKTVANNFNNFYTTIADNLVSRLGESNNIFQDYLKNPNEHSFFLKEIEPDEVLSLLNKINAKKSADLFGISPRFLKSSAFELHKKLTTLFNMSITQGKFPNILKKTKVIPIFKAGSKMEVGNYRPISLLPLFGKLLEKLIHARMYSFLIKHKLIVGNQYGFQKKKSTEHAIFDIHSQVIDSFENQEIPCCIFLDFAKAFDTVNHEILLKKLLHYGFRGKTHNWLTSYLSNRTQCVQIGDELSDFKPINCGVPQGSVLGPLLFLLYINDIVSSSNILKFQLFADDTCIFYSNRNRDILESTLNTELNKVSDWLIVNKLSLNVSKSNALTFRAKNANDLPLLNLTINNEKIEEKTSAKYLGVLFDNKLTWKSQIDQISKKLIKNNALLAKLRHFVSNDKLRTIYNALIQPHIDYGLVSWGAAADANLNKISLLQRKAIRIITFKKQEDDSAPLFKQEKLLPLNKCAILQNCKFIWKFVNSQLPASINSLFITHQIHYASRHVNELKFNLPYKRTSLGTSFLFYSGIKNWNNLPLSVKSTKSLNNFKNKLKTLLLE